jgi:Tol biopolymer transport system component
MEGNMKRIAISGIIFAVALAAFSAPAPDSKKAQVLLQAGTAKETVQGDLKGAIELYRQAVREAGANRAVAAKALVRMGQCYEKLGDEESRKAFERVVREFADQKEAVEEARKHLAKKAAQAPTGIVAQQLGAKLGGIDYGAAISRDGRRIAYTGRGVFVQDLVTGEQIRFGGPVSPGASLRFAIISPNGKSVAYAKWASPTALPELCVIRADGSNLHVLAGDKDHGAYPLGWSPDGKHILARFFSRDRKEDRAALVSVGDGSSKWIGSQIRQARFSHDGRYIAFVKFHSPDSKNSGIFLLPAAGGAEIPLLANAGRATALAWAPDGKRLLFVSDRRQEDDLWAISVEEGKPAGPIELVKERVEYLLDITREGDCYYQTRTVARDLYVAEFDQETGKLIGRPRQVASGHVIGGAAWSPNGELLAYYAWRGSQGAQKSTVVIRSTKSGEERELSLKDPWYFWKPQWFPDSRSLFIHSWDGKLRQLDVQTSEYRPVLESATIPVYRDDNANLNYDTPVVLAADGRTIYYLAGDQGAHQTRILRRDLQGGPETELCRRSANFVRRLSLSPDGARLAFVERTPAATTDANGGDKWVYRIMTLATSGGEPKEVYRTSPPWIEGTAWTSDGRRLLFSWGLPNASRDIFTIPAEGGEAQPLGIGLHVLYYLNIHPNGKQIVFTDEDWNNQLWVLKNLFSQAKPAR